MGLEGLTGLPDPLQPAVSIQIRQIADTVGLPLFDTSGRETTLTAAGEELLAASRNLDDAWNRFESAISELVARETPRLLGARIDLTGLAKDGMRPDALLFGETQNRVVITVASADAGRVLKQASLLGVPAARIGVVGGDALVVRTADGGREVLRLP